MTEREARPAKPPAGGSGVTPPASTRGRGRAPGAGEVAKAARKILPDLDTDHPAGELLAAMATRLAQDVDESVEVRDRVAAVRALMDVIDKLDAAPPPPVGGIPTPGGEPSDDDDNPLGIPAVPPTVGDTPPG